MLNHLENKKQQSLQDPQTFFDILSDVLLKKSNKELIHTNTFKKHMSNYMMCRYLSMNNNLLPYVELIQKYNTVLSAEQLYCWCYDIIPKQKSGFIKYISKSKKEKKKEDETD